jgi:hypothetical protein
MVKITIEVNDGRKVERLLMAVSNDVRQFAQEVDQATTEIANRIQRLIDRGQGISSEDKQEFTRITESLRQLAHDPENPVQNVT